MFKKILFPFFKKDTHSYLTEKWWFRLVIVIYSTFLIITPLIIFYNYDNSQVTSCSYSSGLKNPFDIGNITQINENIDLNYKKFDECYRGTFFIGAGLGLIATLVINFFIQLIFFKVVINYIVLGLKKNKLKEIIQKNHY